MTKELNLQYLYFRTHYLHETVLYKPTQLEGGWVAAPRQRKLLKCDSGLS